MSRYAEKELPPEDIQVGCYGLRTFKVHTKYGLTPLNYEGPYWKDGKCIAECLADSSARIRAMFADGTLRIPEGATLEAMFSLHKAPHMDCRCGAYAARTMEGLFQFASTQMRDLVTVVAAEGTTIIGQYGLRTEAARIVAYWTPKKGIAKICAEQCGEDATRWESLDAMLANYKLEWGGPNLAGLPWHLMFPNRTTQAPERKRNWVFRMVTSRPWHATWTVLCAIFFVSDVSTAVRTGELHHWLSMTVNIASALLMIWWGRLNFQRLLRKKV